MCKPRTTFYLIRWGSLSELHLYGSGQACLLVWLGMMKAGWLGSMRSDICSRIKFIIFLGHSTKRAVPLS